MRRVSILLLCATTALLACAGHGSSALPPCGPEGAARIPFSAESSYAIAYPGGPEPTPAPSPSYVGFAVGAQSSDGKQIELDLDGFDPSMPQLTCVTTLRGSFSSASVTHRPVAALVTIDEILQDGLSARGRVLRAWFGSNGSLYYVDGFSFDGPIIVP